MTSSRPSIRETEVSDFYNVQMDKTHAKDGEGFFPVKYHFMFYMEKDEMFSIDDIEITLLSISDIAEVLTKEPDKFNKYFSMAVA